MRLDHLLSIFINRKVKLAITVIDRTVCAVKSDKWIMPPDLVLIF